jgi:potassium/hydrogen antiporter
MYPVDGLIFLAGTLLLLAILSTTLSGRLGVPGLVLFIGIGMLAGEEGIGRIAFDDHSLAHAIGTLALVLILFDGGLQTRWEAFRAAWKPAVTLSTLGVIATAGITGAAAAWIMDVPILLGLLLGSIVGSTDAAAVFSILRGQGLQLKERIAATLEIESGSNDPMAVLLTLACVSLVLAEVQPGWALVGFFLQQAVIGAVGGVVIGYLGAWLCNRVSLTAVGLYPALVLGVGLLAYGVPAYLGGSGFLSVYLAGLVLGNAQIVFRRGVFLAHDGGAWIAQIAMFVMLGLLATPSRVMSVALEGFLVALVLMFLARPLAVFGTLFPSGFSLREMLFLSWVGLKGAIPIILATYPLVLGVPGGDLLFNVVFFVVLVSALSQGWSIPVVARWLGVWKERPEPQPAVTLEISSVKHLEGDIVEYRVEPGALAAGRRVRELALPESAVIAMIARGDELVAPRGSTAIHPDDYVFVMLKPEVRPFVDRMFAPRRGKLKTASDFLELPMDAGTRVSDLEEFYDIHLDPDPDRTLGDLMEERLEGEAREGSEILAGEIRLVALRVVDGRIELVGVEVPLEP